MLCSFYIAYHLRHLCLSFVLIALEKGKERNLDVFNEGQVKSERGIIKLNFDAKHVLMYLSIRLFRITFFNDRLYAAQLSKYPLK